MKTIVFNIIPDKYDKDSWLSDNRKYSIMFNWGKVFRFSNKKKFNRFLKKIEKDLNNVLYELNIITADLYSFYRENYFYIVGNEIQSKFNDIEHIFLKLYNLYPTPFKVVQNIQIIIQLQNDILMYLNALAIKLNLHHQRRNYISMQNRINNIIAFLENYGEN